MKTNSILKLCSDTEKYVFDRSPIKYIGPGYWFEKYASKSSGLIQEYEKILRQKNKISEKELAQLTRETNKK